MNSQALLTDCTYIGVMMNLTFGEWLEDQYKSRGWLQKDFATRVGVRNTTVSNWVGGSSMPDEVNCDRIARALGIDRNEVRRRAGRREVTVHTGDATLTARTTPQSTEVPLTDSQTLTQDVHNHLSRIEKEVSRIASGLRRAGLIPVDVETAIDAVRVPVIGRVPADSLRWTAGMEDEEDVEITRAEAGDARAPFGLVTTGDCLRSLGIYSGDVVICDRALGREPRDRQLVVLRIGGDVTLKRWCVVSNGIELRDGDEQVVHTLSDADDVEIIGFYLTFKPIAPR